MVELGIAVAIQVREERRGGKARSEALAIHLGIDRVAVPIRVGVRQAGGGDFIEAWRAVGCAPLGAGRDARIAVAHHGHVVVALFQIKMIERQLDILIVVDPVA